MCSPYSVSKLHRKEIVRIKYLNQTCGLAISFSRVHFSKFSQTRANHFKKQSLNVTTFITLACEIITDVMVVPECFTTN